MNDQVDERTNKMSEVSAGSKRLIYELDLFRGTLLIDVMTSKKRYFPNKHSYVIGMGILKQCFRML